MPALPWWRRLKKDWDVVPLTPSPYVTPWVRNCTRNKIEPCSNVVQEASREVVERELASIPPTSIIANQHAYPDPPRVAYPRWAVKPPKVPGVYFCYDERGICKYVGSSKDMNARMGSNEIVRSGDYIAWLEFPYNTYLFAESYYIGLLRPYKNFGRYGERIKAVGRFDETNRP